MPPMDEASPVASTEHTYVESFELVGVDAVPLLLVAGAKGAARLTLSGVAEHAAAEMAVVVEAAIRAAGIDPESRTIDVVDRLRRESGDTRARSIGVNAIGLAAFLAAAGKLDRHLVDQYAVAAALTADGRLAPIRGVVSMARHAQASGRRGIVVDRDNEREASLVEGLDVRVCSTAAEALAFFRGDQCAATPAQSWNSRVEPSCSMDEVQGRGRAKEALAIAVAGGHGALLLGAPGTGKTMLARRAAQLVPRHTGSTLLDVASVHSAAGLLTNGSTHPSVGAFRAPHHTCSDAGMVGSAFGRRPGECSLAHHGVLFLDELPEFRQQTVESIAVVARAGDIPCNHPIPSSLPADFIPMAAANPCPCGFRGNSQRRCSCSAGAIEGYLDALRVRRDLFPITIWLDGSQDATTLSEATMLEWVANARAAAAERRQRRLNAWSPKAGIAGQAPRTEGAVRALRAFGPANEDKVFRIARTIADFVGPKNPVDEAAVAKAAQLCGFA